MASNYITKYPEYLEQMTTQLSKQKALLKLQEKAKEQYMKDNKDVKNVNDFDMHYGENGIHTPWIYRPFLFYGISKDDIVFLDYYRDSVEFMQERVNHADILFLTGGLPD